MKKRNNIFLNHIRKNKNWIKIRSLILILFMCGLNTFAWFIYITTVDNKVSANVIGWDIKFTNSNQEVIESANIVIESMYPGMPEFRNENKIYNKSDLNAQFSYIIKEINLFGKIYTIGKDFTNEEIIQMLKNEFPFKVNFLTSSNELLANKEMIFAITVNWQYELPNTYIKVNKFYDYSPSFKYYEKINNEYIETDVTIDNFSTKVSNGIYLTLDDADTYWGEQSYVFKKDNSDKEPLTFRLDLKVNQKN